MSWDLSNDKPIYLQLVDHIKTDILSGVYPCGVSFPSVRDLATQAAVNPNTMQKALSVLEQEGLLITNRTSGRTVTADSSLIQQLRDEMVSSLFQDFWESIMQLGYDKEEAKAMIAKQIN